MRNGVLLRKISGIKRTQPRGRKQRWCTSSGDWIFLARRKISAYRGISFSVQWIIFWKGVSNFPSFFWRNKYRSAFIEEKMLLDVEGRSIQIVISAMSNIVYIYTYDAVLEYIRAPRSLNSDARKIFCKVPFHIFEDGCLEEPTYKDLGRTDTRYSVMGFPCFICFIERRVWEWG